MNKLKTAIVALLIAGGTIGAFAFTKSENNTENSKQTTYYWFDANTNAYLGQKTVSQQDDDCGPIKQVDCAYGYNAITGTPGNEQPSGSRQATVQTERQ